MTKPEQAGLRESVQFLWRTRPDGLRFNVRLPDEQVDAILAIFESTCMEVIEAGRVDGMFIEWNGLNLADIGLMKEVLSKLLGRGEEG